MALSDYALQSCIDKVFLSSCPKQNRSKVRDTLAVVNYAIVYTLCILRLFVCVRYSTHTKLVGGSVALSSIKMLQY